MVPPAAKVKAVVPVIEPVLVPVPPLATGKTPVTPVVSGSPVAFVNTAALGVPKAGVVNVGDEDKTTLPLPVEEVTPVPPFATAIVVPLHVPLVIVPTLVKLEPVTVEFKVVPVKVPASAVTVISAVPLNDTPLIFLAVASLDAVVAFPVKAPVKPVALIVPLVTTDVTSVLPN